MRAGGKQRRAQRGPEVKDRETRLLSKRAIEVEGELKVTLVATSCAMEFESCVQVQEPISCQQRLRLSLSDNESRLLTISSLPIHRMQQWLR